MPDPMVTTDWLAERLGEVALVDATLPKVGQPGHGRDSYEAGHIPGAVFFDINGVADETTDLPHMLPTPEAFAAAVGQLGLSRDEPVVVYDAHGVYSAPRVWWTLRTMGFPEVYVLDGGLPKWRAEGREVETDAAAPAPTDVDVRFEPALVRDLVSVGVALETGVAQVVDARSAARFRGEAPEPRASLRSGHMPGACNLPFDQVTTPDGRLQSAEAITAAFRAAGVDLDRPIITTCGSGVTASTLALALARIGREDVAVYDGSWSEWGANPDVPIVTGP
jgi:thiosulfate/3-mercaptopyruvate sulfurtransferase